VRDPAHLAGDTEEEALLINGVVVNGDGRPVGDARVALVDAPAEVPDIAVLTGEDGHFSIGVPVSGSYRVAAYGDAGHALETVEVGPGGAARVRLVIQP